MVHHYERYAWMMITLVMLFLWGLGGKAGFDINAQKSVEDTGKSLSSDILSFGGIVFGSFTGVSTPYFHILTLIDADADVSPVGPSSGRLQLSSPR